MGVVLKISSREHLAAKRAVLWLMLGEYKTDTLRRVYMYLQFVFTPLMIEVLFPEGSSLYLMVADVGIVCCSSNDSFSREACAALDGFGLVQH
jgi:hypothetical protein